MNAYFQLPTVLMNSKPALPTALLSFSTQSISSSTSRPTRHAASCLIVFQPIACNGGALHPGAQVEVSVTLGCFSPQVLAALWRKSLPPCSQPSPPTRGLLLLLSSDDVRGEGLSYQEHSALLLTRQDTCGPFPCTLGGVSEPQKPHTRPTLSPPWAP